MRSQEIVEKRLTAGVDPSSLSKLTTSLLDPATPQTSVVQIRAAPVRT